MKWFIVLHFVLHGQVHDVVSKQFAFGTQQECKDAVGLVQNYITLKPDETLDMSCRML